MRKPKVGRRRFLLRVSFQAALLIEFELNTKPQAENEIAENVFICELLSNVDGSFGDKMHEINHLMER